MPKPYYTRSYKKRSINSHIKQKSKDPVTFGFDAKLAQNLVNFLSIPEQYKKDPLLESFATQLPNWGLSKKQWLITKSRFEKAVTNVKNPPKASSATVYAQAISKPPKPLSMKEKQLEEIYEKLLNLSGNDVKSSSEIKEIMDACSVASSVDLDSLIKELEDDETIKDVQVEYPEVHEATIIWYADSTFLEVNTGDKVMRIHTMKLKHDNDNENLIILEGPMGKSIAVTDSMDLKAVLHEVPYVHIHNMKTNAVLMFSRNEDGLLVHGQSGILLDIR